LPKEPRISNEVLEHKAINSVCVYTNYSF